MASYRSRCAAIAALLVGVAAPAAAGGLDVLARGGGPEQVVILYPGDQSTVFDDDGSIAVQVLVTPLFNRQTGERVELYLNGRRIRPGGKGLQLSGVAGGLYSLQARVVGADGRAIANSDPVSFYVWKTGGEPETAKRE